MTLAAGVVEAGWPLPRVTIASTRCLAHARPPTDWTANSTWLRDVGAIPVFPSAQLMEGADA